MMIRIAKVLVIGTVLSLGLLAGGCNSDSGSGDSGGGSPGSCSTTSSNITTCTDYTGSVWTSTVVQSGCTSPGTYSASACTSTGRIGSCTINSGQSNEYVERFLTGYNDTTARAACSGLSGTYASG